MTTNDLLAARIVHLLHADPKWGRVHRLAKGLKVKRAEIRAALQADAREGLVETPDGGSVWRLTTKARDLIRDAEAGAAA